MESSEFPADNSEGVLKGGFKQVSEAALGSFEELSLEYSPEEEGTMMIYTTLSGL